MTSEVKKLYKEALKNEEFNEEIKTADPEGYAKPTMFSSDTLKHIYVSVYYGWLVAKGKFIKANYY